MRHDVINTQTTERIFHGVKFRLVTEQVPDFDPDLSFLGEYTYKLEPPVIVRSKGWFLGEWEIEEREVVAQGDGVIDSDKDPESAAWHKKWGEEHEAYPEDELFNWYGGETEKWTVEASGYRVLARDDGVFVDRQAYPYFKPPIENYIGPNSTEGEKAEAYKYCLQNWRLMEAYSNQNWYMTGVITTLYVEGEEIDDDSLWGVESDGDYWKEVAAEQERSLLRGFVMKAESRVKEAIRAASAVSMVSKWLDKEHRKIEKARALAEKERHSAGNSL